ncbi:cI-like repressor [Streptococcus sp. HMSC034F02]|mgnify:FL=1|jgi:phage repressor protein C with HTH and peptisase S24 domain/DNA-binding Xre family transcriptional regulator|uniref:helix-turn-helix domain-containing protein n=1 Tax=Streptococcus TaxID=1301 RepID=UPI0008AA1C45|nr:MULTISPECIES: XRE family transcriptional regulator [Streptococcus]MCW0964434.1 XRE family transcriptional regulator [Streptococcus anginosus]MDB8649089.1 XRE family transcriptional regulator [Streptococcus anginosus]MDU7641316.1 XRE family transcriptional regulator [Streptococcus anginosus]MED5834363.1 XRE family transcriptional regulator [Streptococcus anginosus]MED5836316.1 XRE family transcriptional regulator [Streptococcus anginosus]
MSIGSKIKQRRQEMSISVDELAQKLNVSRTTIYRYEKGEISKMPTETLEKIARILNTTPAYFMGWNDSPEVKSNILSIYNQLEQPRQEKVVDFAQEQLDEQNNKVTTPTIDTIDEDIEYITDYVEGLVAAGHGAYQEDNLHMEVSLLADEVPDSYDTIAKVAGDSMEPLIHDNDLLFIEASSQVDPNDIGIFQVNGKNFVKKFKRDYDGTYYLQSLNGANYPDIYLNENDEIRTIGRVVDIYREN